ADGSWDAPTASCEAFCPPHPTLAYGSISTGVKTTVGEEVVLECNKGYTLSNPKVANPDNSQKSMHCQMDGNTGEEVVLECNKGYTLSNPKVANPDNS
ncbi:hypothetical protein T484DRAFT_1820838, partial [Baffinella frigidus]